MKVRNPIPKELHIGKIIQEIMTEKGITQTLVAKKTGRHSTTISKTLKQRSIQASIIYEISLVIGVDLFDELSRRYMPDDIRKDPNSEELEQVKNQLQECWLELRHTKKENELLHQQVKYLQQALDMLKDKED